MEIPVKQKPPQERFKFRTPPKQDRPLFKLTIPRSMESAAERSRITQRTGSRPPSVDPGVYISPKTIPRKTYKTKSGQLRAYSPTPSGSTLDTEQIRRGYSITPRRYGSLRSGSLTPTPSPLGSPIRGTPPQQSRSPSILRSQSTRSSRQISRSRSPTTTGIFQAPLGLCINVLINGVKLQTGFSTIHKYNFMTESTAQRCGLITNAVRRHEEQYLENTPMDHAYKKTREQETDIVIGQKTAPDGTVSDVTITIDDIRIINNGNFYNRSQSLQNFQNRLFLIIGMDSIEDLGIQLDVKNKKIKIPNPDYQQPIEKRNITIKAFS